MTDDRLISLSEKRLKKANTEYSAAVLTQNAGFYDVASTRVYYAAFHAIRAILALGNVDFKKHSQVIGYFNKHYIHTNLIDRSLGSVIVNVSKSRNNSDYDDFYEAESKEVEDNIADVFKLIKSIEQYIAEKTGQVFTL